MWIAKGKEELHREWLMENSSDLGIGALAYAQRWAELMEKDLSVSQDAYTTIMDFAFQTSIDADTDGITGGMFQHAVKYLASCWAHGDILKDWYATHYKEDLFRAQEALTRTM